MAKMNLLEALQESLERTKSYVDVELAKKADKHNHPYMPVQSLSSGDLDTIKTTGYYSLKNTLTNSPTSGHAMLFVDFSVGTPVQIFKHDTTFKLYQRTWNSSSSTWSAWTSVMANDISGNAASATKATQDSAGQQINTTYIKGLSVSGKTITYTKGDGTTGTITTQDTNTTYSAATTSANGLMTSAMVTKLNGIAEGANKYTHPSYTAKSAGFYKVTVDASGHVSATTAVAKADIEGLLTGAITSHTHSYIPMSGNTGAYSVTGNVEFASPANNTFRGVVGKCGVNDYWRVGGSSTADNAGYMEIATADDNSEPIYVRQYTGAYATLNRTATLLDASGNTSFPGSITTGNKVTMQYNSTSESLDFIFI